MSEEIVVPDNVLTISQPSPISELEVVEGFCINFDHEMPNRWWRFWQRVFFGFRWRNLAIDLSTATPG